MNRAAMTTSATQVPVHISASSAVACGDDQLSKDRPQESVKSKSQAMPDPSMYPARITNFHQWWTHYYRLELERESEGDTERANEFRARKEFVLQSLVTETIARRHTKSLENELAQRKQKWANSRWIALLFGTIGVVCLCVLSGIALDATMDGFSTYVREPVHRMAIDGPIRWRSLSRMMCVLLVLPEVSLVGANLLFLPVALVVGVMILWRSVPPPATTTANTTVTTAGGNTPATCVPWGWVAAVDRALITEHIGATATLTVFLFLFLMGVDLALHKVIGA